MYIPVMTPFVTVGGPHTMTILSTTCGSDIFSGAVKGGRERGRE